MHPILANPRLLVLYLSGWLPLGGLLAAAFVLLYLIGLPALLYMAMAWQGFSPATLFEKAPLTLNGMLVPLFFFTLVVWVGQRDKHFGMTTRLYCLPIATWQLVACRLLQGTVTVAILCLIALEVNKGLFAMSWPAAGPVLSMAVMAMWLQAAYWTLLAAQ